MPNDNESVVQKVAMPRLPQRGRTIKCLPLGIRASNFKRGLVQDAPFKASVVHCDGKLAAVFFVGKNKHQLDVLVPNIFKQLERGKAIPDSISHGPAPHDFA